MEDKTFQDLVYQLRTIKLTVNQTDNLKHAVSAKQRNDLAAKSNPNPELTIVIEDLLAKHMKEDMDEFLKSRQCLNCVNGWLICMFHLVQTAGILLTSFAAGTGRTSLVWGGVILNSLASLMQIYIKAHDASLKKMMSGLKKMKDGTYVDYDIGAFDEGKEGKQVQVDVTEKASSVADGEPHGK